MRRFVTRARGKIFPVSGMNWSLGLVANRALTLMWPIHVFQHGWVKGTICSRIYLHERWTGLFSALCNLTTLDMTPILELESTRIEPLCDRMLELAGWEASEAPLTVTR